MRPYKELRWPRFWPFLRIKDELPATKRGKRKASNYGVSIVIRRDVLENEPWVLQQEIYESRYWLRHPWRLVDFVWFYKRARMLRMFSLFHIYRYSNRRVTKAAAHLSQVEAASRAQEIRAKFESPHRARTWVYKPTEREWKEWQARDYARSIHGASNYPFFAAAGWDEERVYQEIVRHL